MTSTGHSGQPEPQISDDGPIPSHRPVASIGLPVYNGIAYLERAIRSLLDQEFRDFELIICDNTSDDGSYELAKSYADKDPRIRLSRNSENIGAIRNAQRVLAKARGDFFMWASADDYWRPEFLERLIQELIKYPKAGVAMCAAVPVRDEGETGRYVRFLDHKDPGGMTAFQRAWGLGSREKYSWFITGVFRRELLQRASPYYIEGGAPDRIILTHLALCSEFRYVDEALYHRQLHAKSHEERYPNEAYARNLANGLWGDFAFLTTLFSSLVRSSIVPTECKLYAPVITARFAVTRIGGRFTPWLLEKGITQKRDKLDDFSLTELREELLSVRMELNEAYDRYKIREQDRKDKIVRLQTLERERKATIVELNRNLKALEGEYKSTIISLNRQLKDLDGERRTSISELSQKLKASERERKVATVDLHQQLKATRLELAESETKAKELVREIAEKAKELADRNNALAEKELALARADRMIADQNAARDRLAEEIAALREELAKKDPSIAADQRSEAAFPPT